MLLAANAPAQPARDGEPVIQAEALFTAGRKDVEHGDYRSACGKFAESQRLDPAVGTLINLADCEEHLGELARAWEHWREAVERLSSDDERRPVVAERAAAADKRVPRLTLKLAPGAVPAADWSIRRDDVEIPVRLLDVATPVDTGEHTVTLDVPGRARSRYVVTLAEGARETIELAVGPPELSAPPPPMPATPTPVERPRAATTSSRWIGLGLVGLGAAAIGIGTATGLAAVGKKDDLADNCFPADVCNERGADAAGDGRALSIASTTSFIVGGAAALAGLYFLFFRASQPSPAMPSSR
jgi:hypothetical protein